MDCFPSKPSLHLRSRLSARHHWSFTDTPFTQTLAELNANHQPRYHNNSHETDGGTWRPNGSKMPKRKCKFTEKLQNKFQCFRLGRDPWEAECMTCRAGTYVSVSNKGASDLEAHISSAKHRSAAKRASGKQTDCSARPGDALTAAEGVFAFHSAMDCGCALLRKAVPHWECEAEAIAAHSVLGALEALGDIPYCAVSVDGGRHGALAVYPLLIHYFDWKDGGVQSKLVEIKNLPDDSADRVAEYVKDTLEKRGISSKCVAFTGDSCNTMFGAARCDEEGNSVFANLKKSLPNKALIHVGCPAHVLNNCVQYGADTLDVDIENIILKMYQYFHIYAVHTENLKEFCQFVDVEYRSLLSQTKTRWLSLFLAVERLLQMFSAVKAFLLSGEKTPSLIKKFFEDDFSEIYLWHMHSLRCVFQSHIQEMERENNSIVEVKKILNKVHAMLLERKTNNFMSLKVKGLLAQKHKDGLGKRCDYFSAQAQGLYTSCLEYLEKWMAPLEEFSSFMWMDLSEIPNWNDIEACIKHLGEKGVPIDDAKCFDQLTSLKKFTERCSSDGDFSDLQAHKKWTKYFERSKSIDFHSELLKIAQFFFAIPSHSANVDRVFSLMQSQWTKEKNHLSVESLKGLLCTQYNFRHMSCKDFHAYLISNQGLLRKIPSLGKYTRAHQKD